VAPLAAEIWLAARGHGATVHFFFLLSRPAQYRHGQRELDPGEPLPRFMARAKRGLGTPGGLLGPLTVFDAWAKAQ